MPSKQVTALCGELLHVLPQMSINALLAHSRKRVERDVGTADNLGLTPTSRAAPGDSQHVPAWHQRQFGIHHIYPPPIGLLARRRLVVVRQGLEEKRRGFEGCRGCHFASKRTMPRVKTDAGLRVINLSESTMHTTQLALADHLHLLIRRLGISCMLLRAELAPCGGPEVHCLGV